MATHNFPKTKKNTKVIFSTGMITAKVFWDTENVVYTIFLTERRRIYAD